MALLNVAAGMTEAGYERRHTCHLTRPLRGRLHCCQVVCVHHRIWGVGAWFGVVSGGEGGGGWVVVGGGGVGTDVMDRRVIDGRSRRYFVFSSHLFITTWWLPPSFMSEWSSVIDAVLLIDHQCERLPLQASA